MTRPTIERHAPAITTLHAACLFCSGRGRTPIGPDGEHAQCDDCKGCGMAITWAARAKLIGGHWHVTIWAGRKGSRANLGTLIMDADDWLEFQAQGCRMVPPLEILEL